MAAEPAGLVSFEQARHIVEDHASRLRPRGRELLGLLDANGRVLAEPVHADRDFPPFPRAARDGYAVRASDLEKLPATLEVIGEIKAGATPPQIPQLASGKAAAIMTGAAAPVGADAVVMVEHTTRAGDRLEITRSVSAGGNIVPSASDEKPRENFMPPRARIIHPRSALSRPVR